jgi:hypothetical protein
VVSLGERSPIYCFFFSVRRKFEPGRNMKQGKTKVERHVSCFKENQHARHLRRSLASEQRGVYGEDV